MVPVKHYNINCFNSLGLNYWGFPKSGNTSLKYYLLRANDIDRFEDLLETHDENDDIKRWVHSRSVMTYIDPETAESNGNLNIAAVRHPVSRFLSMYNDFVHKRSGKSAGVQGSEFREEFNKFRENPSIEGLIDLLSRFPDKDRDLHFKSQSSYCRSESIVYLKLEHVGEILPKIDSRIEMGKKLHTTDNKEELSDRLVSRILDLFEEDNILWIT